MNHLYSLKYDQMKNNAPDKDGGAESVILYPAQGNERKLCLILLDGSRISLNYNFLVWADYSPQAGTITLGFTSHTVSMGGLNMDKLFESIELHMPQKIICKEDRYNALSEQGKPVVNNIEITSKNSV